LDFFNSKIPFTRQQAAGAADDFNIHPRPSIAMDDLLELSLKELRNRLIRRYAFFKFRVHSRGVFHTLRVSTHWSQADVIAVAMLIAAGLRLRH
jgi:hypothetical protein